MVYGILAIEVDSRKVELMLTGYQSTLPIGCRLGVQKVAEMYADEYIKQAINSGIKPFTGQLFNLTRAIQVSENTWGVQMPEQGIMLDRMRPHYVKLIPRNRPITEWATRHGFVGYGFGLNMVYVRPHPFISKAHHAARRRIRRLVESELNKKIRQKGR